MNMAPGRSGPNGADNLEEHLRAVERIFSSPMVKRYLELMEQNAHLRAQVEVYEKLSHYERERSGDRQPPREEARNEREMFERRAREMMEKQAAEKREMGREIEKLEARLRDAQAELEKVKESHKSEKKKKD